MKKGLLILIFLFVTIGATHAQIEKPRNILEVGVSGGLNLNKMEFQPTIRQHLHQGITGGLNVRYTSEKYFSMICAAQLEVNFAQRGMLEDFDNGTTNNYSRLINYIVF